MRGGTHLRLGVGCDTRLLARAPPLNIKSNFQLGRGGGLTEGGSNRPCCGFELAHAG
jgi:hypothetical protein